MAKTVILIDDDQDDLDILKETLIEIDPSLLCISFIYPVEAVRVITTELIMVPDFVITDFNMAGMTGTQVVRELRTKKELRNTCITVMSTAMNDDLTSTLKYHGADFCFQKPYSILDYAKLLRPVFHQNSVSLN